MEAILSVNAGSSTLKFALYPVRNETLEPALLSGNIQGLEPAGVPVMTWQIGSSLMQPQTLSHSNDSVFTGALVALRDGLDGAWHDALPALAQLQLRAVAHRVVHGGTHFSSSVVVTPDICEQLAQLNPLAPLHQPHNLQGIHSFACAFPDVPQVACFDTAFHASLPQEARLFALPAHLTEQGVLRYGFHGLSYQYVSQTLALHSRRADERVLMAHLGNGASLCVAHHGRSVATTMGFSAVDGLMMGTRCGALDAGVLLYLLEQGWDHQRLQALLYKQSGLLGVSGLSADMRRLRQAATEGHTAAQLAIDLFCYRVVREAGAMVACAQGLDVLVFTGGIGEHDAALRSAVAQRLHWLGLRINTKANATAQGDAIVPIHAADSTIEAWVIPTDEGRVAAQEAWQLMS